MGARKWGGGGSRAVQEGPEVRGQAWRCLTLRVLLSTDPLPSAYPSPGPSLPCRAPTLGLQAHTDPLLLPKKRPSQVLPWLLSLQPLQALGHFHAWCHRAEPKAPAPPGFGVGPGGDNTYVLLCAKCLEVSKRWDLCRTISRVNKRLRHSLIGVLGTSQQL